MIVSVVMPIYNEAQFIQRSLAAVLSQDYPDLEVLIVDGLSTDGTPDRVRAMIAANPRARLLTNPGRIQSCALNIGIQAAQGDVIVRVDGHTVIASDYVSQCVRALQETGADTVGGPMRCVGITPMGWAIAAAYRSPFRVPSRVAISRRAEYVDTVYMGAWPRSVFERVGGFDETLAVNEDYELNYRIRKAGGRVYLSPDICSEYYGRQTLRALWQQFFLYGRWKLRMLLKSPASTRLRHLVAPAFVAVLIGGAALALLIPFAAWMWVSILASYLLANATASIRQASRDGWSLLPRLPLVFACIHLAWGIGFWAEIVQQGWAAVRRS